MITECVPPRWPYRGSIRFRAATGEKQPSVQHVLERRFSEGTVKLENADRAAVNRALAVCAGIAA